MAYTEIALSLNERITQRAQELGFDLVRVTSAEPFVEDGWAAQERVRHGFMDGMPWFTQKRVQQASDPQLLLPGARCFIAVALSYLPQQEDKRTDGQTGNEGDVPSVHPELVEGRERKGQGSEHVERAFPPPSSPSPFEGEGIALLGKVARYAQWGDYHRVMKVKLRALAGDLPQITGRPVRSRVFVDDAPLLERAVARRAGLGWFGKNTNILTSAHGSWVFLGALLTELELEADEPLKKSCGECIRCMSACPTGAIVAPYVIDARRCISYLTIEHRGPIPRDLRPLVGDWVFGCDVCQEVCPVNEGVPGAGMPELKRTGFEALELARLLSLAEDEFAKRFRNTPIKRAKLVGLKRNACVALGNIGDSRAVPALGRALRESEPLVRGHAAWALGRIGGPETPTLLEQALADEASAEVREEMMLALGEAQARLPQGRTPPDHLA